MRLTTLLPTLLVVFLCFSTSNLTAGDGGGPFINGAMLGSIEHEEITGMVKLRNGNIVIVGWTDSFDPWLTGGYRETHSGTIDGFIAVMSSDLKSVLSFTFFGGPNSDKISGVAEDPSGNIIVIGTTESENLPTTVGTIFPLYRAGIDGFLFAFSSDLKTIKYGTYITGPKDEYPKVIKVDLSGSIYICGSTNSTFGFPTNNGYDKTHNGNIDAFVMKIAPGAAIINFSTYFGSDGTDEFLGMTLTNSGALMCTGYTTSGGYETYPQVNPTQWWQTKDRPYDWSYNGGNSDAVLTVFSEDGAQLIVSTYYGGADADYGRAVVVDERGRINLIGDSYSSDLPFISGIQGTNRGGSDLFIAQLSETGRTLLAATYLGGDKDDFASTAAQYNQDLFAITGTSNSTNFPLFGGGATNDLAGSRNAFLMLAGVPLIEVSTFIGGNGSEEFKACHVDSSKIITLAGFSTSESVALGRGVATNNGARGTKDAFVVQFARGSENLVTPVGGEKFCIGQQTTVSWSVVDMPQGETYSLDIQSSLDGPWTPIATGITLKSYQWKPDASLIPSAEYSMRLRSSRGHDSRVVSKFTLYPAVGFSKSPNSVTACVGDSIAISAVATGGELRYIWKRDGIVLSNQTAPFITIPVFSAENAGKYECTVQSVCGVMAVSNTAQVSIGTKPVIGQQPVGGSIAVGGSISLSVTATGTNLMYQWYKNDAPIDGMVTSTLVIPSASMTDAGTYRCNIIGKCGAVESKEVDVAVVTTSVSETSYTNEVYVLPQPSDGSSTIGCAVAFTAVQLYSLQGELVLKKIADGPIHSISLETALLPSGVYTAIIHSNGDTLAVVPLFVSH